MALTNFGPSPKYSTAIIIVTKAAYKIVPPSCAITWFLLFWRTSPAKYAEELNPRYQAAREHQSITLHRKVRVELRCKLQIVIDPWLLPDHRSCYCLLNWRTHCSLKQKSKRQLKEQSP